MKETSSGLRHRAANAQLSSEPGEVVSRSRFGLMGHLTMLKTCSHFQCYIRRRATKATQKSVSGLFIWVRIHQMMAPKSAVYQRMSTRSVKLQMTVHLRTKAIIEGAHPRRDPLYIYI